MSLSETLCRRYNRLFRVSLEEQIEFAKLEQSDLQAYHESYFDWEARDRDLSLVTKYFGEISNATILDLGCGCGGFTSYLGRQSHRAVGIDIDDIKVASGQRIIERNAQTNVELRHYEGTRIPYDDGTFDVVLCIDVIEHVSDPPKVIAEIARVLREGGILRMGFGPPWKHAHGKHMWDKLPGWWTHILMPRSANMKVAGYSEKTTWDDLGMNQMTIRRFRKLMRESGLTQLHYYERINKFIKPLKYLPFIKEYFVGALGGVWQKPVSH